MTTISFDQARRLALSAQGFDRPRPARVLVIRTDKVGDLLLSMPAIRAVRASMPEAHLTVLVSAYNEPVIRGWTVPDAVVTYDAAWPWRHRAAVIRGLRRQRFDACLVLHPDLEAYCVARATGAVLRVGTVHARRVLDRASAPALLTHRVISAVEWAARRGAPVPHEIDLTRQVIERAGLQWGDGELAVDVQPDARAWAGALAARWHRPGAPVVAVHLSAKWFESGWTAPQVASLLSALAAVRPDAGVIATCGPHDAGAASAIRQAAGLDRVCVDCDHREAWVDRRNRIVVVPVDFPRWAAALACASVVVTPDTGALHLASALKRPVVAIYSAAGFARNSAQFAPWRVPNRVLRAGSWDETAPRIVGAASELLDPERTTEPGEAP